MLIQKLRTIRAAAAVLATFIALLAVTGYQVASAREGNCPRPPRTPWHT